jgi:putative Holliday junction resolvase
VIEVALGFDFGSRKIGIAVGRASTGNAEGIATIPCNPKTTLWSAINELIEYWQPDTLVVGLPFALNGTESKTTGFARKFGKDLDLRFNLPVCFIDETLTTDYADAIIRESTKNGKQITSRRKSIRDKLAAELILMTFLNEHKNTKTR